MNPKRIAPPLALALALLAGCDAEESRLHKVAVDLAKVPATVMEAARKKMPGVEITDAWENHLDTNKEIHSYEIKGRKTSTGKVCEVRVGLDGKILESEGL
jgi:hypothetical protein